MTNLRFMAILAGVFATQLSLASCGSEEGSEWHSDAFDHDTWCRQFFHSSCANQQRCGLVPEGDACEWQARADHPYCRLSAGASSRFSSCLAEMDAAGCDDWRAGSFEQRHRSCQQLLTEVR